MGRIAIILARTVFVALLAGSAPAADGDDWLARWTALLEKADRASSRGDAASAESWFVEAVEMARERAPGTMRDVRSRDALAFFLLSSGRYDEAEKLYAALVPEWRRLLGPGQPRLATCLNNLAVARFHLGRAGAAVEPMREALEIWTRSLGPDHPDTIRAARSLAVLRGRASGTAPPPDADPGAAVR